MLILKKLLGTSIAVLGCPILLALVAVLLAVNTALVALVWNKLDLHHVFSAGTLSFKECVGVGVVMMLFGG